MSWRVMDPRECVDMWAIGKSDQERLRLLGPVIFARLRLAPVKRLPPVPSLICAREVT